MKTRILVSSVVAALLLGTVLMALEPSDYELDIPSGSNNNSAVQIKHVDDFGDVYYSKSYKNAKACVEKAAHAHRQTIKPAPKEITTALKESFDAMQQIKKGEISAAKKNLASASEHFNKALAANPKLDMVPVSTLIEVDELELPVKQINEHVKLAERALTSNHIQDARDILVPMRDEMRIQTQYIPMKIYPGATKSALAALNKSDKSKALEMMSMALGAVVTEETVIPVSLLDAQDKVILAMKMEKSKKNDASDLISDAKRDLQKAVALGYLNENDAEYKQLREKIESVEHAIAGENRLEKYYHEVSEAFASAMKKAQNESHKLFSELNKK